jgi:hypothetical protein
VDLRTTGLIVLCSLLLVVGALWVWAAWPGAPPADVPPAAPAAENRAPNPVRSAAGAWRDVRCVVPYSREGDEVVVAAVGNREATQVAIVEDGGFTLVLPSEPLVMLFDVPGLETVQATIDGAGACVLASPPQKKVAVTVSLRLPSGRVPGDATISGCGAERVWVASDPVLHYALSEPCSLEAWSRGGMTQVSDPAGIDPALGDVQLELRFPWEDPAGLRLSVAKRDGAFSILSVDSRAAELLSMGDFVRLDAGPPDTTVELLVLDAEGDERVVHVPRERSDER